PASRSAGRSRTPPARGRARPSSRRRPHRPPAFAVTRGRGGPAQRLCRVDGGGAPRRPSTIPPGGGHSRVPPGWAGWVGSGASAGRIRPGGRSVDTIWDPQAERMPAPERADLQARCLDELLRRLAEGSSPYRERLAAAGVGPGARVGLDGLGDLPVTTNRAGKR